MSTRCAVCGSKNVVKEFKKEGYDVTKGVVGTVLVGIPGALAGAGGKDVTYYHCADCGQVMNRPMYQVESDWIDKLLANPQDWLLSLREEKKKYKNIEWDENQNENKKIDIQSLSFEEQREMKKRQREEKVNEWVEILIKKLQQNPYLKYEDLVTPNATSLNGDYSFDAFKKLDEQCRLGSEIINGKVHYRLVTDPNEMRELFIEAETEKYVKEMFNSNSDTYKNMFLANVEIRKFYTSEEISQICKETFADVMDFEKPYVFKWFLKKLYSELLFNQIVENNKIAFRTNEEALKAKEEKYQSFEQKRQEENEEIKQKILDFLTQNEEYYHIYEIIKNSKELSEYTVQRLTPLVRELETEKRITSKVEMKRNYYAIAGIEEILEKRRIEEEKKREEQRRIQRENINKKIKEEEEKYNKELETLQKQLSEQETIFEANKSKIFGAGAKAKKEAKQSIEYYSNQIEKLKQDYLNKKSSLQAELQKI